MTDFVRETVEYIKSLLPDEDDRSYLSDKEIETMWEWHSQERFANWLVHDGLERSYAMGMCAGWAARDRQVKGEAL